MTEKELYNEQKLENDQEVLIDETELSEEMQKELEKEFETEFGVAEKTPEEITAEKLSDFFKVMEWNKLGMKRNEAVEIARLKHSNSTRIVYEHPEKRFITLGMLSASGNLLQYTYNSHTVVKFIRKYFKFDKVEEDFDLTSVSKETPDADFTSAD